MCLLLFAVFRSQLPSLQMLCAVILVAHCCFACRPKEIQLKEGEKVVKMRVKLSTGQNLTSEFRDVCSDPQPLS